MATAAPALEGTTRPTARASRALIAMTTLRTMMRYMTTPVTPLLARLFGYCHRQRNPQLGPNFTEPGVGPDFVFKAECSTGQWTRGPGQVRGPSTYAQNEWVGIAYGRSEALWAANSSSVMAPESRSSASLAISSAMDGGAITEAGAGAWWAAITASTASRSCSNSGCCFLASRHRRASTSRVSNYRTLDPLGYPQR